MPTPNLTDVLIEFNFTPEELIGAKLLDANKLAYYRTLYAKMYKLRGSLQAPESLELDRAYIQQICELDGKLNMLQELMDGHKAALDQYNQRNEAAGNNQNEDVAKRAALQVHTIPINS